MPGSRVPGPIDGHLQSIDVQDGTGPLIAMPGGGSVGSPSHVGQSAHAASAAAAGALQATMVDKDGVLKSARVKPSIASTIERGPMEMVRGIIVHQTGGPSAQSSLDGYKSRNANGAHFLIDKDGTIYQTASLHRRTWHVGKLKARCLIQQTCSPAEIKAYAKFDPVGMNKRESAKAVPDRFPSNEDSIGIELVGTTLPPKAGAEPPYETVTDAQNASLKWLIGELTRLLRVPMTEIFRHPQVSWKNTTEASTAKWQ
jgi:N-acetyl-anhydromuramyl-L-alanine amidase AmpD